MNRRRFLAFGLTGAALLGAGGGLSWLTLGYRVGPKDIPVALSKKELAVVRAIVEALLPAEPDLPGGVELGVHQRIDEEVWSAPDALRSDLKAAIQLLEHLPPLYGYPGRLSSLEPQQRLACLLTLMNAGPRPVVQAANALKQMCMLFYWSCDETWGGIGYDGPWVKTAKPPESHLRYRSILEGSLS